MEQFIPLLAIIISIVVLAVFFIMSRNIARITSQFPHTVSGLISRADEEAYAGNKEKAKEYYLRAKYKYHINNDMPEASKNLRMTEIDTMISDLLK